MKKEIFEWLLREFAGKFPEMTGDNIKQVFYKPQDIKKFLIEFYEKAEIDLSPPPH